MNSPLPLDALSGPLVFPEPACPEPAPCPEAVLYPLQPRRRFFPIRIPRRPRPPQPPKAETIAPATPPPEAAPAPPAPPPDPVSLQAKLHALHAKIRETSPGIRIPASKKPLTRSQQATHAAIVAFHRKHGRCPRPCELGELMGVSTQSAHSRLLGLANRGAIAYVGARAFRQRYRLVFLKRPIRLADVLLAIKARRPNRVYMRYLGHIQGQTAFILQFGPNGGPLLEWLLHADSLDKQSERTITFLYELLCGDDSPLGEGTVRALKQAIIPTRGD